jgi:amino acid transporter
LTDSRDASPAGGLKRALRRRDVAAFAVNSIIGAGIFGMPAALAASAGPASLAVLLAAFLLVAGVALCAAEVSSRFEVTGGPVVFARAALGPTAGFAIGWLMYLSRISTFGAVAVIMFDYAAGLWPLLGAPLPRSIAIITLVALLTGFNLRGVVMGAGLSNVLVVAKLAPLLLLAPAGVLLAGLPQDSAQAWPGVSQLGAGFLIAFFACMGFENATVVAGELPDPRRQLPPAMLGGFALTGLLYALLMLGCMAALPDLAASKRPLADLAAQLAGPLGATVIAVTALCSCAGNLSVSMLVSPRVLFALAEQRELPRVIAAVSPGTRVPATAILITAGLVCLLTVTGTFVHLATIAVISRMLMYGSICLALPLLRREGPAPLTLPGGPAIAVTALLVCVAVLATAAPATLRDVAVVLAAGLLLRWATHRTTA